MSTSRLVQSAPFWVRTFIGRPRLLISAALFVALLFVLPVDRGSTRFLIAWDVACATYLTLLGAMFARSDEPGMQRRADRENPGASLILFLSIFAVVASVVAIVAELRGLRENGIDQIGASRIALAGVTILVSWLFIHTVFAVHYAHEFYFGTEDREGLEFPGEERPDYWDFLYFSMNLGAAAQTSDVQIETRRMRRLVLGHTIVAFLFNTTILALAINVGASLM